MDKAVQVLHRLQELEQGSLQSFEQEVSTHKSYLQGLIEGVRSRFGLPWARAAPPPAAAGPQTEVGRWVPAWMAACLFFARLLVIPPPYDC